MRVCREANKARAAAGALVVHQATKALVPTATGEKKEYLPSAQLAKRLPSAWPRPVWHAPWKMYRVVSGHLGYLLISLFLLLLAWTPHVSVLHLSCWGTGNCCPNLLSLVASS